MQWMSRSDTFMRNPMQASLEAQLGVMQTIIKKRPSERNFNTHVDK